MKHGRYLFYTAAVVGILLVPSVGMCVRATKEPIGNETAVPFPSLVNQDGTLNGSFLSGLGDWFEQHLAFRPELVTADSVLKKDLFGVSSQDTVITGKDGWLYYAATLDDFQHRDEVSERTLFNEAHNVKLLQDAFEEAGSTFLFTIAPNKNTICPEMMPDRYQIRVAASSDFERLIPYLQKEGVHYVDLTSVFRDGQTDAAGNVPTYYARDSHWNETGAMLVYRRLMEETGISGYETYEDTVPEKTKDYYGDLGRMLYPAGLYPEEELHYIASPAWHFSNGAASVEENTIETESAEGAGSLVMYRDSFGNSLLPFFAQEFASAFFSKTEPVSRDDLLRGADVVILEKVERHLPTLASVPAMINGPLRENTEDTDSPRTDAEDSATDSADSYEEKATLETSVSGDMLVFSGRLDPSVTAVDTRVLVEITDSSGTQTREAFTTTDGSGDSGYLLYLDQDLVDGAPLGVRVFAESTGDQESGSRLLVFRQGQAPAAAAEAGGQQGDEATAEVSTQPEEVSSDTQAVPSEAGTEAESTDTGSTESTAAATEQVTESATEEETEEAPETDTEAASADTEDAAEEKKEDSSEKTAEKGSAEKAPATESAGAGSASESGKEKDAAEKPAAAKTDSKKADSAKPAAADSAQSASTASSAKKAAATEEEKAAAAASKKAAEEAAAAAASQKAAEEAAAAASQKAAEEAAAAAASQKAAEEAAAAAASQKAAEEAAAAASQKAAEEAAAAASQKAAEEAAAAAASQKAAEEAAAAAASQKAAEEAAAAQKAAEEAAAAAAQQPAARTEVSRTYIEDCGMDSGYWDIEYSDGTHEYIDVP